MNMRQLPSSTFVLMAVLAAAGCSSTGTPTAPAAGSAAAPAPRVTAVANFVTPTGQGGGRAELLETPAGVQLTVRVQGLTPGSHGFHIHANGACAPGPDAASGNIVAFGAAGGHFDPGVSHNHGQPGTPAHQAHGGELPNITIGADGSGTLTYVNSNVTLSPGKQSILGRTLIVHADADDYQTDPAGNSGGRALCALISPAQPGPVTGRAIFEGSHVYPEGIAIDARNGDAYVGSTSEGHIYRIRPGADKAEMFQMGGAMGRQGAYGMKVDAAGRLWVLDGPGGHLSVIDLATAAPLATVRSPKDSHTFLNDLVAAPDGYVYVTDSFRPLVFRARYVPGAALTLEPWLDLTPTPLRYVPNQINLNGIVASPDGRALLAVQLVTGQLWRIDVASKAVTLVPVEGGDLKNGDGLVLQGANELYVVRNQDNELTRLQLAEGWTSARVTGRLTDPRLKYPTTAAQSPQGLMVVNGQLNKLKDPPPHLPFDVVTISPLPR